MASSEGLTVEYSAPYGLVGALTPVTNGIATVACNAMTMIAAGNSIIFNCHPAAKLAGAMASASSTRPSLRREDPPTSRS
jgi:acyl-CoA reductase-like NAD-dependent aldehyde dehydrogenase